ncbi:nuclear acid binding [Plasmopara halstedii]|uniref:Nuclear acid binding n=1 Tax=Plasmopara halstedii TaxID=4781 RepID=A0A0P1A6W8_PLAHL|nr:nuclear acid binding [Plasmopara halstedii]CEG35834.1 nuclear acid binding [Plasmopara halstedii]|eukprot:XP_024572203.1 nuclear acid binding [Plasmopara halstedii]
METECKTLWMGDIQMHWDETFIVSLFASAAEQPIVKLIRDKVTGYPAGYGFLEFPTQRGAQQVLETFNGQLIPNTLHRFRMNWGAGGRRIETSDDHSIFVGDLAPDVADELLLSTFSARFTTVRGAKVVMDPITRMSKGFGFVRFGSKEEADQALQTMNGVFCSSRPMRVSVATERNKARQQLGFSMSEEDGANTTVFVGGLDPGTSEEELRTRFGALGEIVSVKVPPGRGCGFVQYTTKEAAEAAISQMNGSVVGGVKVRCAWGRSAAARVANYGSYYPQQYGQYQAGYQNYYGYNAAYAYPQYQQGTYGYAAYGQYAQQGTQSQGGYQHQQVQPVGSQLPQTANYGLPQRQQDQQPDFTRPDDIEAMNRRFASQRAYQNMPPAPNAAYTPMAADVANGTAMAGSI